MKKGHKHRKKKRKEPTLKESVHALLEGVGIVMDRLDEIEQQLGGRQNIYLAEKPSDREISAAANRSSMGAATNMTLWPPWDGRHL